MMELAHLDQLAHALLDYLLYPFITLLMCLLSVFVVLGNLLVVTAIWHENQLHSVTNYLIASLAAADCLVGALVMPFSIISEMIIGSWTFGPVLCDLWHSFDVLASTASIMNLCAISLDRYLAITNPICYPTKMTPKRVALLIVSLWTCSSLISFPAILWWHAVGDGPLQQVGPERWLASVSPSSSSAAAAAAADASSSNLSSMIDESQLTISAQEKLNARLEATDWMPPERPPDRRLPPSPSSSLQDNNNNNNLNRRPPDQHHQETKPPPPDVRYKCPFTDDTYYLLFSSFISFYGPLCVMLYAYICIYRAAVQQTRFLKYGSKQVSVGHATGSCYSEASGVEGAAGGGASGKAGGGGSGGGGRHNKKNKRLRHTSERSQTANCDNYEQHLVLRAHRGGGANNLVKLDSAASERAKSQHKHKQQQQQQQQQQQASPTDEDGDDEDEDESEATTRGIGRRDHQMAPSSLDRTSTLSESLLEGGHLRPASLERVPQADAQMVSKPTSANSASRPLRANLMMSQRDKLRVESQRFDPPSISSSHSTPSATAKPGVAGESIRTLATEAGGGELKPTREAQLESAAASQKLFKTSGSTSSSGSSGGCDGTVAAATSSRQASAAASSSLPQTAGRQTDVGHHFRLMKALRASPQVPPQLPASLVPLIMMNSDTSTDSSIVTVVTRPIGDTSLSETTGTGAERPPGDPDGVGRVGPGERKRTDADVGACPNQTGGGEESATKAAYHHQVTINLGFRDGDNSGSESGGGGSRPATRSAANQAQTVNGKGQILHYNSDKLIQSIVDLSNIHYIDCGGAQGRVVDTSNERVAACASGEAATRDDTLTNESPARKSRTGEQLVAAAAANQENEPENSRLLARGATTRVVAHSKQVVGVVGGRQQRSVGKKLTKLAKERKAAKTLGIVVGVFILCWLPFFVVNILVALCGLKCIYKPDILFSIVTWLGWLNSAMNPVIYACWSRDFRRAFRRVLCAWVEFLCWDGTRLARKLKLKKAPHYSSGSAQRSGTSMEINAGAVNSHSSGVGNSKAAVLRTNSTAATANNNNSHKFLLAD